MGIITPTLWDIPCILWAISTSTPNPGVLSGSLLSLSPNLCECAKSWLIPLTVDVAIVGMLRAGSACSEQFSDGPDVIGNPRCHRRSRAQRTMDAPEVVSGVQEQDRCPMMVIALAERLGKPRKSTLAMRSENVRSSTILWGDSHSSPRSLERRYWCSALRINLA